MSPAPTPQAGAPCGAAGMPGAAGWGCLGAHPARQASEIGWMELSGAGDPPSAPEPHFLL